MFWFLFTRKGNLMPFLSCLSTFLIASVDAATITIQSPNDQEWGNFGYSVSGVGDIDGDGRGDIVVGAPGEDNSSLDRAGRAYVISGSDRTVLFPLVSPNAQQNGQFGSAVSDAPDMNGDGGIDVIVAAVGEGTVPSQEYVGRVYTFSGNDGSLFRTLTSPNPVEEGSFGQSVSGIPDLNDDGRGDVIVGAYSEPTGSGPADPGRVYVLSGRDAAYLRPLDSPNPEELGWFGWTVSAVPDVNGDGLWDVAVGAPRESIAVAGTREGRAYIYSGSNGDLLRPLVSPNPEGEGGFGWSVAGFPDINGDGRGDLLVGAAGEIGPGDLYGTGRAYVFSGSDGVLLRTLQSPNAETGGGFGSSVSAVPDYDYDGTWDFLVGAQHESSISGATQVGRAYIFSGLTGTLLETLTSPNEEAGSFQGFAHSVSGVPDTDGDLRADALVGAPSESPGSSQDDAGRAYVFTNDDPPPPTPTFTNTPTPTVTDTLEPTSTHTPTPVNVPPVAVLAHAPRSGPVPLVVECVGAGVDPDGILTEYAWSFNRYWVGARSYIISSATIEDSTSYVFDWPGVHHVIFKVADNRGGIDLATGTVEVWAATPTFTPTSVSVVTPTASPTATMTGAPANTPTETPVATPTNTDGPSPTPSPSPSATSEISATPTPTSDQTETATPTTDRTETVTPTATETPTLSMLDQADINRDGVIDELDLIELMNWWKELTGWGDV